MSDPQQPQPHTRAISRYVQILERIFFDHYQPGQTEVAFTRPEIEQVAAELGIRLPKNLGDVVYSFRYREVLPPRVAATAPSGTQWIILPSGSARYRFVAVSPDLATVVPNPLIALVKVPDATPGVITRYALGDEQALLARLRYNRLIDIFTGLTCYSLQNHLRTTVRGMGQVETDEIYVGLDQRGAHYVVPVQAKAGRDKLSVVQILQDMELCNEKFPDLICRPVAAQFMRDQTIALFAFAATTSNAVGVALTIEKHYQLVVPRDMAPEELAQYRQMQNEYIA
ncbi:MAG: endonuclease [Chloroflexia bacterium]